jgi:PBP1b-binding outer membrane lipoprotein LpoB
MKAIGVALLAALVLAACGSTAQSFAPERSMTPATQRPSDIPPTPLPTVSVESTPLPTPGPEPTLTGEFPGPGATVPPGTPVLA